ncbi:MAG: carboxypeptidase-like regulatory domain-containing protein [Acidobacteriota bacterium]
MAVPAVADGAPAAPSIEETLKASPLLLERVRARVERELDGRGSDVDLEKLERTVAAAERIYRQLDAPPAAHDELRSLRREVRRARLGASAVTEALPVEPPAGQPRATPPSASTPAADPILLPGSDACEDAPLLGFGTFLGSTAAATRDTAASCASNSVSGDVWYRVRIPGFASTLFANTAGSSFDTVLTIHEGCPNEDFNTTLELVCDDNSGPGQTSAASFSPFETPTEVVVRIAGALTEAGDYRLTLGEGGVIQGRIVSDVDGSPIVGVDVQIREAASFTTYGAVTNNAGRYTFTDLPAGSYRLVAFTNNVFLGEVYDDIPCSPFGDCPVNQGTPIAVELGQTVEVEEIGLTLGGSVTGRVVDRRTGAPLSFAEVALQRNDDFGTFFTAFTGQDGTYRAEGLPAGTYTAWTQIFGPYRNQAFDGVDCQQCPPPEATPLVVEEAQTRDGIDFRVARLGAILGTVEDTEGNPASGQVVVAFEPETGLVNAVFSNPDGSYSLGATDPGRYFVVAGEIGLGLVPELFREVPCIESVFGDCDFNRGERVEVELEETITDIDFTLSPGATISGRVTVAGEGTPVDAVRVTLTDDVGIFIAGQNVDPTDGSFRFEGLAGGTYLVDAEPLFEDFYRVVFRDAVCLPECDLDQATPIVVPFEGSRTDIDVALPRSASISGRITTAEDGSPLAEATVVAFGESGSRQGVTDGDGFYRITGLFPGEVTLTAQVTGGGFIPESRQVSVAASQQILGEDFALSPGASIAGTIRMKSGGPVVGGGRVQVETADGSEVFLQFYDGGQEVPYRLRGLLPGDYYVFVSPGFQPGAQGVAQLWPGSQCTTGFIDPTCRAGASLVSVPTADADVEGIDFELERFGEVLGTIRSAVTGNGVGAEIEMWNEAGQLVATTGSFDGVYAFTNPPPGVFYFVARPTEGPLGYVDFVFGGGPCIDLGCDPTSGTPVTVEFDRTVSPFFTIPRGGSLSGRLRDGDGAPLDSIFGRLELYDDAGRLISQRNTFTDQWLFGALPDGRYRVVARDVNGEFVAQVLGGDSCVADVCDLSSSPGFEVVNGGDLGGLDFFLERADEAEVAGRAVEEGTGVPVVNATVLAWALDGFVLAETRTGPDGRYRLPLREPATLSINSPSFAGEVWPDIPCPAAGCGSVASAGDIILPRPGLQEGFDFTLERDASCGSPAELCTLNDRFRISTRWRTGDAQGEGVPVSLTNETGYFWFFDPNNVEVVIKTLDACDGFGNFWVFSAGLTNVGVEITVVDTVTGGTRVYENEEGNLFVPIFDTAAFDTCGADPLPSTAPPSAPAIVPTAALPEKTCLSSPISGCLTGERFQVEATYTVDGVTQPARVEPLTPDTAYLWFFGPDNVEVVLKVLDACNGFDNFWVFATGLTNVGVDLTVTDTVTDAVWTYSNPVGADFAPVADTAAFECP